MRRGKSALWILAGLAVGTAVGALAWSIQLERHRKSLFHPSPRRRMTALSYLRAHPSVDSARLLGDYLAWEAHPFLRRRASRILRRTERVLRS